MQSEEPIKSEIPSDEFIDAIQYDQVTDFITFLLKALPVLDNIEIES